MAWISMVVTAEQRRKI